MQAPNAETIEGAADTLQQIQKDSTKPPRYPLLSEFIFNSELKELDSAIGAATVAKLKATPLPKSDLPHAFRMGYLLGLQTARICVAESVKVIQADIKPEEVL